MYFLAPTRPAHPARYLSYLTASSSGLLQQDAIVLSLSLSLSLSRVFFSLFAPCFPIFRSAGESQRACNYVFVGFFFQRRTPFHFHFYLAFNGAVFFSSFFWAFFFWFTVSNFLCCRRVVFFRSFFDFPSSNRSSLSLSLSVLSCCLSIRFPNRVSQVEQRRHHKRFRTPSPFSFGATWPVRTSRRRRRRTKDVPCGFGASAAASASAAAAAAAACKRAYNGRRRYLGRPIRSVTVAVLGRASSRGAECIHLGLRLGLLFYHQHRKSGVLLSPVDPVPIFRSTAAARRIIHRGHWGAVHHHHHHQEEEEEEEGEGEEVVV